jgi:hypothetical protein
MLPSTHLGAQGEVTVDTDGNVYTIDADKRVLKLVVCLQNNRLVVR